MRLTIGGCCGWLSKFIAKMRRDRALDIHVSRCRSFGQPIKLGYEVRILPCKVTSSPWRQAMKRWDTIRHTTIADRLCDLTDVEALDLHSRALSKTPAAWDSVE